MRDDRTDDDEEVTNYEISGLTWQQIIISDSTRRIWSRKEETSQACFFGVVQEAAGDITDCEQIDG